MKSFDVGFENAAMRYHDLPGDGPALMFVHGLGCASSCDYPSVAAEPALAGRRRILVDLLGSGFSDRPADFGYGVEDQARMLVRLADHLELPSFDLFGHSMGGAIAIATASLLRDRLAHLVVGEPNLLPGGGFFSRKIAAMSEREFIEGGHDKLAKAARMEGNGIWAASFAATASYAAHRGAASLVAGSNPTWRDQLLALNMPRTMIFGEKSLPDPDADRLPGEGVNVVVVPEAGHSMAWENPAGLAKAIRQGLDRS